MKCNKFYIIATAASGKSTFASKNPVYNGYRIVDFEEHLPPLAGLTKFILYLSRVVKPIRKFIRHRPAIIARRKANYFARVCDFLINHDDPIVVFGRTPPDDFMDMNVHDSIQFSMVLIPEEEHRRNCESRKRDLRNPIPLFHHWTTEFEKIQRIRAESADYAARHGITVYDSFHGAIHDMHTRFNS